MDNYIGKHLLIDCYNCNLDAIKSSKILIQSLNDAADKLCMKVNDTFFYEGDEEITTAANGVKSHICIHSYPDLGYAAVDIYSFDTDIKPARAMAILRASLQPEKIRATSVKRGNISPDMKPNTKSRSTTMHKFKNTRNQVKTAGQKMANYMRHKNEKRDTLGPE